MAAGTTPQKERRQLLLDAAVRTIRRDGADASMNDIATEAGVTKPILYQHFSSKAGLAAALADRFLADLSARLEPVLAPGIPAASAIPHGVSVFVRFATAEPALFRFLTEGAAGAGREAGELPMVTALADVMGDYLSSLTGEAPQHHRTRTWAMAIMGMVIAAVAWWSEELDTDRDALIEDLSDLILNGIGPG